MMIKSKRRYLFLPMALLIAIHGSLMVKWMALWGFFGAILHWFETFMDPISAAAGVDLMALMAMIYVWMLWREKGFNKVVAVVTIPFIVFPSIGLLIYLMISEKNLDGEKASES